MDVSKLLAAHPNDKSIKDIQAKAEAELGAIDKQIKAIDAKGANATAAEKRRVGGVYDGNNSYYKIDITNNTEASTPYFRVFINSIPTTAYEIVKIGEVTYVRVTPSALNTGDQVDVLIYSDQVSALGYYEVPKNLDYNSKNDNFKTLTLGQLRNHLSTMVANSNQVTGNFPGASNLRDLNIKPQGGNILQHASPVLYSELFLEDTNANFLKGLNLARHEYSKLKNKIIRRKQIN